jgi:GNAT superfamily N-acetyltransferase
MFSACPHPTAAAAALTASAVPGHGGPLNHPDAYDRPVDKGESRSLAGGAVLRQVRPGDEDEILDCVRGLAEYEKEPDAVQATAEDLRRVLFGATPSVFAHVVEKDGQVVAIAIWFLNYSTFTGRHGIYLEDLFVREGERRHGYGKALLKALAEVCVQRGYLHFEWAVLAWNEPSIRFYRSIGAVGMDEWRVQRLSGDALTRLAAS